VYKSPLGAYQEKLIKFKDNAFWVVAQICHRRISWKNSFSAKQRLVNSRGKFKLAVITIARFTRGIQREAITTRARNLNIRRKRVHVECYLGEGVSVTFCLRLLATKGGSVKTRNVASERLAKSDKLSENFSYRKIDRQLGFRSHNVRIVNNSHSHNSHSVP